MYLLVDANVAAGYYLPRSLSSEPARERIRLLLDAVRAGTAPHRLLIPNFCIAETFGVFAKHSFGTWNRHLKSAGTIDTRVYRSLRSQLSNDIHNGAFLNQYELSRYHILNVDLVGPIDHNFRLTKARKDRPRTPAGTFDHLIVGMGIQLVHLHGQDNVAIVTTDDRLARIVRKCRSAIPTATVKRLQLDRAKELTGRTFGPAIFPQCLELKGATSSRLTAVLGSWPPPQGKVPKYYRWDGA